MIRAKERAVEIEKEMAARELLRAEEREREKKALEERKARTEQIRREKAEKQEQERLERLRAKEAKEKLKNEKGKEIAEEEEKEKEERRLKKEEEKRLREQEKAEEREKKRLEREKEKQKAKEEKDMREREAERMAQVAREKKRLFEEEMQRVKQVITGAIVAPAGSGSNSTPTYDSPRDGSTRMGYENDDVDITADGDVDGNEHQSHTTETLGESNDNELSRDRSHDSLVTHLLEESSQNNDIDKNPSEPLVESTSMKSMNNLDMLLEKASKRSSKVDFTTEHSVLPTPSHTIAKTKVEKIGKKGSSGGLSGVSLNAEVALPTSIGAAAAALKAAAAATSAEESKNKSAANGWLLHYLIKLNSQFR